MNRAILLDASPVGLVTNPRQSSRNRECAQWLQALLASGARVFLPEIADYEVRRELLRANKTKGIAKLNALAEMLEYLPITTAAMRRAAQLLAQARQTGHPTAADAALDGDMILAAQALTLGLPNVLIATTNVGHLAGFVAAMTWDNIATH